jgi:hypothetical protein
MKTLSQIKAELAIIRDIELPKLDTWDRISGFNDVVKATSTQNPKRYSRSVNFNTRHWGAA